MCRREKLHERSYYPCSSGLACEESRPRIPHRGSAPWCNGDHSHPDARQQCQHLLVRVPRQRLGILEQHGDDSGTHDQRKPERFRHGFAHFDGRSQPRIPPRLQWERRRRPRRTGFFDFLDDHPGLVYRIRRRLVHVPLPHPPRDDAWDLEHGEREHPSDRGYPVRRTDPGHSRATGHVLRDFLGRERGRPGLYPHIRGRLERHRHDSRRWRPRATPTRPMR